MVAGTLAFVYILIDLAFLSVIKPLAAGLGRLAVFSRLRTWIAALGPYPTLVLFLVPVLALEPAKPLGLYLIGSGHIVDGVLVIVVSEVVKVTLVERLFHISRGKLMTIPAFAWVCTRIDGWLARLRALPAWRAAARRLSAVRTMARRVRAAWISWWRALRRRNPD